MQKVRIIIGKFRRPMFGESLQSSLRQRPDFVVESDVDPEQIRASLESQTPTVVILDAASAEAGELFRLASRNVAVIRIGDEGRDVDVKLHQIGPDHIRRLAGLIQDFARDQATLPFARALRKGLQDLAPGVAGRAIA